MKKLALLLSITAIVATFVYVPVSAKTAKEREAELAAQNPLTEAGKLAGASCDAAKAFAYIEQFKTNGSINLAPVPGKTPGINPNFACRLAEYFKAVTAMGCNPRITSGYRSYALQLRMCGAQGKTGCAAPGRSCHQYGAAIDVLGASSGKGCPGGTGALAAKYGLIFGYSGKGNVPADNRKRGRNHFQCIENRTSGRSSGCNIHSCGPGTPPPYDPTAWNNNAYSNSPQLSPSDQPVSPDEWKEKYEPQFQPQEVPTTTPEQKYPDDTATPTEETDDLDEINPWDENSTDENEDTNEDGAGDTDPYYATNQSSATDGAGIKALTERKTTNQTPPKPTNRDTRPNIARQIERHNLLYTMFTTPLDKNTTKLYKQALFGTSAEKESAMTELDKINTNKKATKENFFTGYEYKPTYIQQSHYTPWNYQQRNDPTARENSDRLANFFYKDLPPAHKTPWWKIMLRAVGFNL